MKFRRYQNSKAWVYFSITVNIPGPGFPQGWLSQDVSRLLTSVTIQPLDPEPGNPVLYQYNLMIQREIVPNLVVSPIPAAGLRPLSAGLPGQQPRPGKFNLH